MWPWRKKPAEDPTSQLTAAVAGLVYPSESDAPFDVIRWSREANESAEQAVARHAKATTIERTTLAAFLEGLEGSQDEARFRSLVELIQKSLRDPAVYRAKRDGEAKVEIYAIGRSPAGDWAGVHTTSVET